MTTSLGSPASDNAIPTLSAALSDYMKADELKKLARLIGPCVPSRKAEIVDQIVAYLPRPAGVEVQSTEQLPRAHSRPFQRLNDQTRQMEEGTETIPLAICETERSAQRELLCVLRLVDAGQIRVSDKTHKRRPFPVHGSACRSP